MTVKEANQSIDKGSITLRIGVICHTNNRATISLASIVINAKRLISL